MTTDPLHEALYDEYLQSAWHGAPESPETFLARNGVNSPELRSELDRLYRSVTEEDAARAREEQAAVPEPGRMLGGLKILRRLGQGGMGIVYLAHDEELEREVAVKIIRPEFSGSRTAGVRFDREARAVARLHHPGVVEIYRIGADDDRRFIVMEYVPGEGFDTILARTSEGGRRPPLEQMLRWLVDVARALAAAHAEGIVHRDLKPSNVRIDPEGRARLLDFGLARDLTEDPVTLTRAFVGSPNYSAPEQVEGRTVDARADVYGLGALLYHVATGQPPFGADSVERVLGRILKDQPDPPRRLMPTISRDLEVVIQKAMEKNPADRYPSATSFASDLEAVLEFRPIDARPAGPLRRIWKWTRRRPALAGSTATALLALLALVALVTASAVGERRARGRRADEALASAAAEIARFRSGLDEVEELERGYHDLRRQVGCRFFEPDEIAVLEARESELNRRREARQGVVPRVQGLLQRAAGSGADPARIRRLEAELFLAKFEEAERGDEHDAMEFYRALVRERDRGGELTGDYPGHTVLDLEVTPAEAEIHVFRFALLSDLVDGGERRRVPVPLRGFPPEVTPGSWGLRMLEGDGKLAAGDVILEVAGHPVRDAMLVAEGQGRVQRLDRLVSGQGHPIRDPYGAKRSGKATGIPGAAESRKRFRFRRGGEEFEISGVSLESLGIRVVEPEALVREGDVPVRAWSNGTVVEHTLSRGRETRRTTLPLLVGPRSRVSSVEEERFPRGQALLLFRAPGHQDRRFFLEFGPDQERFDGVRVDLLPADRVPPGLVPVGSLTGERGWLMEREVTFADYLEFLNGASPLEERWLPRTVEVLCVRSSDGRWKWTGAVDPAWPVFGIDFASARAYAAWKSRRDQRAGYPVYYRLPYTRGGTGSWEFPYGSGFRPWWMSSCFARPEPGPEPVRSFPYDESVFGLYDLGGSVSEWLAYWNDDDQTIRLCRGGSWAEGGPATVFSHGISQSPANRSAMVGFRLAADEFHRPKGRARVTITSAPGTEIHLFRLAHLVLEGHSRELRVAPVPIRGVDPRIAPGTRCLRVASGGGSLRPGDLITRIDGRPPGPDWSRAREAVESGGVRVTALTVEGTREIDVSPGVAVRPTAQPLPLSEGLSRVGIERHEGELESGRYVALFRKAGHALQRWLFEVRPRRDRTRHVDLVPVDRAPAGYVRCLAPESTFWVQEHETTWREYLEFLNDPDVRDEIEASGRVRYVPRTEAGLLLRPDDEGRFALPGGWELDAPVAGVSLFDARAFAEWKTRSAPAEHRYAVLSEERLGRILGGFSRERITPHVDPAWFCSGPRSGSAPVMSFPVDESVLGVFDLVGNLREWLDESPYEFGGSWQDIPPQHRFAARSFVDASEADTGKGFRLTLVIPPGTR